MNKKGKILHTRKTVQKWVADIYELFDIAIDKQQATRCLLYIYTTAIGSLICGNFKGIEEADIFKVKQTLTGDTRKIFVSNINIQGHRRVQLGARLDRL